MMRWDGWMRSGLNLALMGLASVAIGSLPAWGQEKPANPPTTKPAAAAAKPDEKTAAAEVFANAQKAYEQKNYQAAADQFRKYIKIYGPQPGVPSARFRLALALAAM